MQNEMKSAEGGQRPTQAPPPPAQPTPPTPQAPAPQPPKKSSALKWVLIILAIIIILGLIAGVGCWFVGRRALRTITEEAEKITEYIPEGVEIPGITPERITEEVPISEEFPKDFPIYTGAKVESSGSYVGFLSVVLTTSDSASKVFKWYKDEIPKAGYEISFEMDTTEGKSIGTEGKGYGGSVIITEEEGRTSIVISLGKE